MLAMGYPCQLHSGMGEADSFIAALPSPGIRSYQTFMDEGHEFDCAQQYAATGGH